MFCKIRESTFITPRGGGGDEDVLKKAHTEGGGGDEDVLKKAHNYTGPLLRLLVNFRCPPFKFLKFSRPPPTKKLGSKEYNLEFSLVIYTICSSQDV
jgi:hypothetical protein